MHTISVSLSHTHTHTHTHTARAGFPLPELLLLAEVHTEDQMGSSHFSGGGADPVLPLPGCSLQKA